MSWPRSDLRSHKESYVRLEQQRWGGRSEICLRVCFSACLLRSAAASIGERAAWSGDGMRQRRPMRRAILFVTPTHSNPSQKGLCLYASAVLPVVSHSTGAVCKCVQCVCWRRSLCVVALTNLLKLPAPMSPLAVAEVQGGREHGPLWKTPVLPLHPTALNATVPQPSWHLPWDALNELKGIQWDTWCSSHGTPLLLCLSAQLCPPAQAQKRNTSRN